MLTLAYIQFFVISAWHWSFRGGTCFVTKWEKRLEELSAIINSGYMLTGDVVEAADLEKRWWPKKVRKPLAFAVWGASFVLLLIAGGVR